MSNRLLAEFVGTFWVAPIIGALLAGLLYRRLAGKLVSLATSPPGSAMSSRPAHNLLL
jgi:hypothetical protein